MPQSVCLDENFNSSVKSALVTVTSKVTVTLDAQIPHMSQNFLASKKIKIREMLKTLIQDRKTNLGRIFCAALVFYHVDFSPGDRFVRPSFRNDGFGSRNELTIII